jgi:uncharacterized Zn finger protein (UPF0148 family)
MLFIHCEYCATAIVPQGLDEDEIEKIKEENSVVCPICGEDCTITELDENDAEVAELDHVLAQLM